MSHKIILERLSGLDTNTVSDAMDFLELEGASCELRPLWECPKIVGRASTIQLAPRNNAVATTHAVSPVIDAIEADDRVLVIAGGIDRISCWGDILANAAVARKVRGTVIDGYCREIEGSESIGFPIFGRGVTMISGRNRLTQLSAGEPVQMAGISVKQDDYVLSDRCGTVLVPSERV